ncbi:hypothetical protein L3Q82_010811, partial [Scortum barcoo]
SPAPGCSVFSGLLTWIATQPHLSFLPASFLITALPIHQRGLVSSVSLPRSSDRADVAAALGSLCYGSFGDLTSHVDPSSGINCINFSGPTAHGGFHRGDSDCLPPVSICSAPRFLSEEAKVAFAINHLTGRVHLWGTAEWERRTPACVSFQAFATELRKVFGNRVWALMLQGEC